jgi:hypothetical protein
MISLRPSLEYNWYPYRSAFDSNYASCF